ncbi:MAG TPA: putative quinol monooxygenase [Gemmatimonadales bacterium]|nr:putative quinol monooxygenase [Gemmatimonadales bacterium]
MTSAADVTVLIRYQAQPGKADQARQELDALIRTVVAEEPDCRRIWLHQNTSGPEQLLLVEHWTSEAAFNGPHMHTPHLTAFIARAPNFLMGPPETSFWRGVSGAER